MKRFISVVLSLAMLLGVAGSLMTIDTVAATTKTVLIEDDFESYKSFEEAAAAGWESTATLAKTDWPSDHTKYLKFRTGTGPKVFRLFSKAVAMQLGSGLTDSDTQIANPGINAKLIAQFDFNSLEFTKDTVTNHCLYALTDNEYKVAASVGTKPSVIGSGYLYAGGSIKDTDTKFIVPKTVEYKLWHSVKFEIQITDSKGDFLPTGPTVKIYHKLADETAWVERTAEWPETDKRGLLNSVKYIDRMVIVTNASARYQAIDNVNIYLENEGAAVASTPAPGQPTPVPEGVTPSPRPERAWMSVITTPAPQVAVSATSAVGNITKDDAAKDAKGVFMTPDGAGAKNGSNWANAFGGSEDSLQKAVDALGEDGTLYVSGGKYSNQKATVSKSGLKIVGVNNGDAKAEFTGSFDPMAATSAEGALFEIAAKVKNVHIENIEIKNYQMGIHTAGENEGLRFYNIGMSYFGDGFYLDGGSSSAGVKCNKDIIIDNCSGYIFKKRFIRFRNGNNGAIVSNCRADAGGKDAWEKSNWPVGVGFETNEFGAWEENITVSDSTFENSYQEPEDKSAYWNGDGISAERTSRNLTFIRVNCFGATDGGWDLKTLNPVLIDCVAMGNKRGFRFWSDECATLINCLGAYSKRIGGGSSTGLWTNGYVEAYNCTFFNNASNQVEVAEGTGRVALVNCIVGYYGVPSSLYPVKGGVFASKPQIKINVAEYEGTNPGFVNMTDEKFYGNGDSWNSKIHNGAIGYHFNPERKTNVNAVTSDYGKMADVYEVYGWAKDSIDFMTVNSYMSPLAHTAFGPSYNATRNEFCAMLVKTLGLKGSKTPTFADVNVTTEFYNEIGIAQEIGLIKGEEDLKGVLIFRPYDSMTREEMMVMLSRALKLAGKLDNSYSANLSAINAFVDKDSIADWAKQEVANMVDKKIIQGADGAINPKGNTTRAEAAVIGQRIFEMK